MRKLLFGLLGIFGLFIIPAHAALPTGYTELEYIESTGTQYLDLDTGTQTGVFKIIADVYAAGSTNWQYLFGYSKDAGGSPLGVWVSNDQIKETFTAGNGNVIADVNKWEHIDITNSNTVTIPDFYIFHVNPTGVTSYTINHGRIKYLQLKKDGDTIRDMVSAKRNSDGVVGMYDTVNNRFYTNAGTGSFIAGPETTGTCANMFNMDWLLNAGGWTKNGGVYTGANGNQYEYAKNGYPITFAPNTQYIITGHFGNNPGLGRFEVVYTDDTTGAIAFNTSVENTDLFAKTYPGKNVKSLRFNYANTGVMEVSNIQVKPAYCSEIQVASTKYTETVFNPLNTALANAVATVNTVVTQTIAQAASIATLQSGKQTRPADNTECPAYKQCLLVEDENGTPHWYQITDPFRDFVAPIIANNVGPASTTNQPGYTQLEYIESTGTQWIDTGIVPNSTTTAEVKFNNSKKTSFVFGSRWSQSPNYDTFGIYTSSSGITSVQHGAAGQAGGTTSIGDVLNQDTIVEIGLNKIKVNDSTEYSYTRGSISTTLQMYLFADNQYNGSAAETMIGKIYYFRAWQDGALVADFVPAQRNSDNVVGMYDTVSKTFFANAGTGTFTAGQVVANTDVPANPTWTATWAANASNGVAAGTVYGEGLCNGVSGTYSTAATSAQTSSANWSVDGVYCWCRATGVDDGDDTTIVDGVGIFGDSYSSAASCAGNCANVCAYFVNRSASFRSAVFGM